MKIGKKQYILIITCFVYFLTSLIVPRFVLAQESQSERCKDVKSEIPLQQEIPIMSEGCCLSENQGKFCVRDIGEYFILFYRYFAGIAGVLAAAMIVFAGIQWVVAAGNKSTIEKAKTTMNGALIGLVLTLSAYLILYTINPQLVSMRVPSLGEFKPVYVGSNYCSAMPTIASLPEPPKDKPCGQIAALPRGDGKTTGYAKDYCCGDQCEVIDGVKLLCGMSKDQTFSEEKKCPEKCFPPGKICQETKENDCGNIDALFDAQNITKNGREIVCRKIDKVWWGDSCDWFYKIEKEPCKTADGWSKVSCTFFGTNNDVDTPCWEINKPRYYKAHFAEIVDVRKWCTDELRAGNNNDSYCCARKEKRYIDCRPSGNNDEVQVPCDKPIFGNELSYNDMPVRYEHDGPVVCQQKCWLQLDLQMKFDDEKTVTSR